VLRINLTINKSRKKKSGIKGSNKKIDDHETVARDSPLTRLQDELISQRKPKKCNNKPHHLHVSVAVQLTVPQEILAFYGHITLTTKITKSRQVSTSWARSIQSIPYHPISIRSFLILPSHLHLGLPSGYFHSGFPHQPPIASSFPPYVAMRPTLTYLVSLLLVPRSKNRVELYLYSP
jgi:hypothetical protein